MRTPIWIGLPYTRLGFHIPWFRLPAFKKVGNNDVIIFEFPRDPFQKYVKRCIGIAGDSISINYGTIIVNSDTMQFPKNGKYIKGYVYESEKVEKLYPYFNGNRDNIGSFVVPHKDMIIDFNNIDDWQTTITLLLQDGNDVKLGKNSFTMIDPREVARTHGFMKYKLLKLVSSGRKVAMREQADRTRFINNLNKEYKANNLVNPWYINYGFENSSYLKNNITINGQSLSEIGT